MKNYINTKTYNSYFNKLNIINISALIVLLVYLLSITLAPIANSIITARYNHSFVNNETNINSFLPISNKLNNNATTAINTTSYINNGQMLNRQINNNNNLQSYINDAKGSVLKLNDTNKSQTQIYSYDAYGKPIPTTNPSLNITNPFMYNGERFDINTALQYLRARFYNPEAKRFINQDTYNLLNKFGYVGGNPVMRTDASGNDWNDFTKWVSDTWDSSAKGKAEIIGAALVGGFVSVYGVYRLGKFARTKYEYNKNPEPQSLLKLKSYGKQLGKGQYGTAYLYNKKVYKVQHNNLNDIHKLLSSPDRIVRKAQAVSQAINNGEMSSFAASMEVFNISDGISTRKILRMDYIPRSSRFDGTYRPGSPAYEELIRNLNKAGMAMVDNNQDNVFRNEFGRAEPADYDFVYTIPSAGRRLSIGTRAVLEFNNGEWAKWFKYSQQYA